MRKWPLCLAAVCFLVIQMILAGGFGLAKDSRPSPLELCAGENDPVTVTGTVCRREQTENYQVYYLTDNQVRTDQQIIKESKLLVYVKQENANQNKNSNFFSADSEKKQSNNSDEERKQIKTGNRILITGTVSFFEHATNPGNFDRKFYYQKQGIHALIWAENIQQEDDSCWFFREKLAELRQTCAEKLKTSLGEKYGGGMCAVLLGDKSSLDEEMKELYQKSGIGHILAISGLHMSFLGIGVYRMLRKAGFGFGISGGMGIVFLIFYTCMTGGSISAVRALIMFIIRIGADITGRTYDMATSLSVAAAVIALIQPLYLLDAGFWLSFGAVFAVAVISPALEKSRILPTRICAGASIQAVLLPFLLYWYFEIPPYSMILNLLVLPLMPFVLISGIIGIIFSAPVSVLGSLFLQVCRYILMFYEKASAFTMELPYGRIVTGRPTVVLIIIYYIFLFLICGLAAGKKADAQKEEKKQLYKCSRKMFAAVLCVLPLCFCLFTGLSYRKKGEIRITMIDVGQGDRLYIRGPEGKNYLMDGGSTDEADVGKYRLEPFLKSQGVKTLDYVFVTHGDEDHINGIRELLENQKLGICIRTLVVPPVEIPDEKLWELAVLASENGTRVATIQKDQKISEGKMEWKCLGPPIDYDGEPGNAASLVMSLQYEEFDMLFTGDVEAEGEELLVKNSISADDYDVLKVAHHGSRNSTSEAFLAWASPEIALISAGKGNRYGHPHEETLERLDSVKCKIFVTSECGAVSIRSDGKKLLIETPFSDIIKTLWKI